VTHGLLQLLTPFDLICIEISRKIGNLFVSAKTCHCGTSKRQPLQSENIPSLNPQNWMILA
jgi:hypothetical protein